MDRILYQNYFTPRVVTDFWKEDRDAIVTHLKQMKDRVIRSIVVIRYVEVDDVLNRTIVEYFFQNSGSTTREEICNASCHAGQDLAVLAGIGSVADTVGVMVKLGWHASGHPSVIAHRFQCDGIVPSFFR